MPISTERLIIKMDRMAEKRHLSDVEKIKFYESFSGIRVPDIPEDELTDEEKAEDIAYRVLEEMETGKVSYEDIPLLFDRARRAMNLCNTCIAAYEACYSTCEHKVARDRYILKGVEAGEQKFGGDYEKENVGHFWEITATRPFMRLLACNADLLLEQNKRREAILIYERLLHLDPGDSVGARMPLQSLYLELGEYDKYIDLIDLFEEEPIPHYYYNYALYLYMTEGETAEASEAMQEAIEFNPYVLPFLKAEKKIPRDSLPNYQPSRETGAIVYCHDALYLWRQQFGIQKWLKKF